MALPTRAAQRIDVDNELDHDNAHAVSYIRRLFLRMPGLRTLFMYPDRTTKTPRSTAWLDGLRGVAALEVVLHHYHLRFLGPSYNYAYGSTPDTYQWWRLPFIRNYYHSAHAMVNVFFVISGFVLTQRSLSLVRARQYDKLFPALSSAVFRRLVRIFLPVVPITFFGMLLIRWGIKASGAGFLPIELHSSFLRQALDWYWATEKFANPFHNYHNQWDLVHPYEHVMWTLPVEYYGSIVCYVSVLGLARVRNTAKRCAIILCIIYLALRQANWWSANFLAGTLLADFLLSQEKGAVMPIKPKSSRSYNVFSTIMWSVLFVWSFYICGMPDPKPGDYEIPGYELYVSLTPDSFRGIEDGGRFWWMIGGVGLTWSISQLSYIRKIFERPLCQYLGKISFMLYLVHTYTWEIVGGPLKTWLEHSRMATKFDESLQKEVEYVASRWSEHFVYVVFWICILPVLALVSGLATRFIDEPSIRFAKTLENYFIQDDEQASGNTD